MDAAESASLEAFKRLLQTAAEPGAVAGNPVQLTETLVGPAAAVVLRRCAVPHDVDQPLLRVVGELDDAAADALYATFAELSLMQVEEQSLAMHERWRTPLWQWWLQDAQRPEFTALSRRLAEWFGRQPKRGTGEEPAERRHMFHLIGYDTDGGLALFEALYRTARHHCRFSECALLIRLVHEYDPLLRPAQRALLRYQEGKLASDRREWHPALPLLRAVADDPAADAEVRLNARVRAAHALRQTQRVAEALALLTPALDSALGLSQKRRVLHEVGEAWRDLGQGDRARVALQQAIVAAEGEEHADLGGLLNSLGTVQLQLRDHGAAVQSFRAALEALRRRHDAMRIGAVLNNLALAQLELCDWDAAEATLHESLASRRAAGDAAGVAMVLFNLSRAQAAQERLADAQRAAEASAAAYDQLGDVDGRARAQLALARLQRRTGDAAASTALLQAIADEPGIGAPIVAAARAELSLRNRRLPWWAWALIVLAALLIVLMVVALAMG